MIDNISEEEISLSEKMLDKLSDAMIECIHMIPDDLSSQKSFEMMDSLIGVFAMKFCTIIAPEGELEKYISHWIEKFKKVSKQQINVLKKIHIKCHKGEENATFQ